MVRDTDREGLKVTTHMSALKFHCRDHAALAGLRGHDSIITPGTSTQSIGLFPAKWPGRQLSPGDQK